MEGDTTGFKITYEMVVDKGYVELERYSDDNYLLYICSRDAPDFEGYQDMCDASIRLSHKELGEFITKLQEVYDHA